MAQTQKALLQLMSGTAAQNSVKTGLPRVMFIDTDTGEIGFWNSTDVGGKRLQNKVITVTDSTLPSTLSAQTIEALITGLYTMTKNITGKSDGKTSPTASIETIYTKKHNFCLAIPAGDSYFSPVVTITENMTITRVDIDCTADKTTFAIQTPSASTTIGIYQVGSGTALYTKSFTVGQTSDTTASFSLTAGMKVYAAIVGSANGLTGYVNINPIGRWS